MGSFDGVGLVWHAGPDQGEGVAVRGTGEVGEAEGAGAVGGVGAGKAFLLVGEAVVAEVEAGGGFRGVEVWEVTTWACDKANIPAQAGGTLAGAGGGSRWEVLYRFDSPRTL